MEKVGFFEEKPGVQSMMRLLSLMSFIVAVYIAIYSIMTKQPGVALDPTSMTYFGFFMVAAFVPKAIQKFAETKIESKTVINNQNNN